MINMDYIEIISNLDKVIPYFQPIYSAESLEIEGFEMLGRYITSEEVISLGPFFLDKDNPDEYKKQVDYVLLEKALTQLVQNDNKISLFIHHYTPNLLEDRGEMFLETLEKFRDRGLENSQIVLEFSNETIPTNSESLEPLIKYFKALDIKIAINRMEMGSQQIERFTRISPDMIKIKARSIGNPQSDYYDRDRLYAISFLARKMGVSLLFEQIEDEEQLRIAWKNGGRYYQGFHLKKPTLVMPEKAHLQLFFKERFERFILIEKKHLARIQSLHTDFHEKLSLSLIKYKKVIHQNNELLTSLTPDFTNECIRLYICDENGFQISGNIVQEQGNWKIHEEYKGKNWSWRPYFLENIMKMRQEKRGLLSDQYGDIETGQSIRTFSYRLDDHRFLFMDLSYEYLYEQADWL
jgi:EAL domain-containing protein (putative c-di-GMP-specific phosphodiesterase class I)